jgi:DegV family protein with EDD domain
MSARVAVVTDSTAYLPAELVERHRVTVVPLQVVIGDRALDEGTQAGPAMVAEALRRRRPVSTSRPAPQVFVDAYRRAAEAGAGAVVSVHLCADMSGTHAAATLAARDASVPVRVVDTRSMGMGLGFAVLAAAEAAEAGADAEEAAAAAEKRAAAVSTFFYVDTLEHLRRGGRIGAAQALLGSALSVKPLLHLVDGRVQPLEKVRTSSRAISRLEEVAVERAAEASVDTVVDIAVHHLASAARATAFAEHLRGRVPRLGRLYLSEVGAVVGAHAGPGMLAVVVSPR